MSVATHSPACDWFCYFKLGPFLPIQSPTRFLQIRNLAALANLIDTPFNTLKGQISTTFADVASTFNAPQLPLPAIRTVDTSIVDHIDRPLVHIAETTALILLALVILVAVTSALVEWSTFRKPSTPYANSGPTPLLLGQLLFPLFFFFCLGERREMRHAP